MPIRLSSRRATRGLAQIVAVSSSAAPSAPAASTNRTNATSAASGSALRPSAAIAAAAPELAGWAVSRFHQARTGPASSASAAGPSWNPTRASRCAPRRSGSPSSDSRRQIVVRRSVVRLGRGWLGRRGLGRRPGQQIRQLTAGLQLSRERGPDLGRIGDRLSGADADRTRSLDRRRIEDDRGESFDERLPDLDHIGIGSGGSCQDSLDVVPRIRQAVLGRPTRQQLGRGLEVELDPPGHSAQSEGLVLAAR